MTAHNEHIDALIARHFEGQLSQPEEKELRDWRDADRENELFFRDMEFVFYASASIREERNFDVDRAWNKVKAKAKVEAGSQKPGILRLPNWRVWSAAAAFVLIALVAYFFLRPGEHQPLEYAALDKPMEVVLGDSSEVVLEPGAKLTALSGDPNARLYALEGKARFRVRHSESHPFILHHGELRIEDLGTEFMVDARTGNDTVFVEVYEGKVRFETVSLQGMDLVAGEKAYYLYSKDGFTVVRPEIPVNETGTFDFRGQELGEVAAILSAHFSTEIELSNNVIANCPIDVNFRDESLAHILDILALTLRLEVEEKEDRIILRGNGCN